MHGSSMPYTTNNDSGQQDYFRINLDPTGIENTNHVEIISKRFQIFWSKDNLFPQSSNHRSKTPDAATVSLAFLTISTLALLSAANCSRLGSSACETEHWGWTPVGEYDE
ncbi:hypothetical protein Pr1d_53470 [Bythopirellula goksoeyrii]|uniref:Uncharacterized protein n=1 Tax=Bythopirellula goksoeyrii TaxID=1400387 RepID=A0A5B9QJ13_9BACT|nr:hypothetical protein Pr1d_53470 [Bythopirellula goksoeyrii]